MNSFRYTTFPQEIVFGAGALEKIADVVSQHGWTRALLVTTRSQRANGNIARIADLLGEKLVAVSDTTQQHVPQSNVDDVTYLAREKSADLLIALGGGSAIGVAKATAHSLQSFDGVYPAQGRRTQDKSPVSSLQSPPPNLQSPISNLQSLISILAIPTTYAGSEMTPVFGVTRERDGVAKKETTNNPRIVPAVVLYDPLLTLDVPPELTASTGINALAHCVEAVYSVTKNPLSTVASLEGARLIYAALPRCVEEGRDVAARTGMLEGAYLAGAALANVAMGLHHGVCHVLGGTANVPHGIANAIVLPHAMRFNADACAPELARIAEAMGIPRAEERAMALEAARRAGELVVRMKLPARLSDVGVRREDLPKLAALAFQNKNVQNNPRKVESVGEMEEFLLEMY